MRRAAASALRARGNRGLWLLAIGETFAWASLYYVFPALLVVWEADLGLTRPQLTLGVTLAVLASALAAPLAGRLIDHGHGAALMGLSAMTGGGLLASLAAVQALWQFLALWGLIGLCLAGCLYEPCFAVVTRARGAAARSAIVSITLVAGFAGTISFPVVHLLSDALGWRGTVAVLGAVAALVVAPVLWLGATMMERHGTCTPGRSADEGEASPALPGSGGTGQAGEGGRVRAVAAVATGAQRRRLLPPRHDPVFWRLGLGLACLGLGHGAILHHLLPMLGERGLPAALAVGAAALIGPSQVAGRIVLAVAGRRLPVTRVADLAFIGMGTAAALLMFAADSAARTIAAVVLFGAVYGTVSILRPVLVRALLGQGGFGTRSGGLALLYLAASATAPWLGALVWRLGGYGLMLAGLVAASGLGLLLCRSAVARASAR